MTINLDWEKIENYITGLLKERSTWIGLCTALGSFVSYLQPDKVDSIATLGTFVIGIILAGIRDPKPPKS